jgi:hypothetical protein
MKALIIYITFVLIGFAISFFTGLFVERQAGSALSLIVFLTMFFSTWGVAWILTILVMDGTLKNAQGREDQRQAEKIGKGAMAAAKANKAA